MHLPIPDSELARKGHVMLWCEECSQHRDFICRDLQYEDIASFHGFPILWCENCQTWAIPGNLRYLIAEPIAWAKKNGHFEVNFNPDGGLQDVDYSRYPPFKFSSMDYMFYPGLWRPQQDGFLTPVFFRRRVLLRYHADPSYDLHWTSNTYGTVVVPPGHHIPFGINRQGLVIMWLGDVAKLPEDEINYLRSENVESDHDLVSDFYRGQIEVEWDYQSKERTLLELHQQLSERFKTEWDVRLSKYDPDRITQTLKDFAEPALWTFKELGNVWQAMNNVLVESLNVDGLKKLAQKYDPEYDTKGIKGLKLLEKVTQSTMVDIPENTMSPFFVLYDLRVVASHKDSDSLRESLNYCYERLGLDPGQHDLQSLHTSLVEQLSGSYKNMISCDLLKKQS